MLFTLIRGGNFIDAIVFVLSSVFVVFLVLPIHEFAHALTATKLGDNTAKWQGRLSINPMRHIDWFGAVMIILVGFGWAKPVPVNPARFRHPKSDMALVSLAGSDGQSFNGDYLLHPLRFYTVYCHKGRYCGSRHLLYSPVFYVHRFN